MTRRSARLPSLSAEVSLSSTFPISMGCVGWEASRPMEFWSCSFVTSAKQSKMKRKGRLLCLLSTTVYNCLQCPERGCFASCAGCHAIACHLYLARVCFQVKTIGPAFPTLTILNCLIATCQPLSLNMSHYICIVCQVLATASPWKLPYGRTCASKVRHEPNKNPHGKYRSTCRMKSQEYEM